MGDEILDANGESMDGVSAKKASELLGSSKKLVMSVKSNFVGKIFSVVSYDADGIHVYSTSNRLLRINPRT